MPRFVWDEIKARSNLRKHGIAFEEACTVFDDPFAFVEAQDHAAEVRYLVTGFSAIHQLLVVVFVEVSDDEEEIRIISARKAERQERKEYEERRDFR